MAEHPALPGDWRAEYNPKPIPDFRFDWDFWHEDYNGPGDWRCGNAASLEACAIEIDALISEHEDA